MGNQDGQQRAIRVELPSRQGIEGLDLQGMDLYIQAVAQGREEFLILEAADGFLQFYGVGDQFVMELRANLPDGDFRTYSVINEGMEQAVERTVLTTPYGRFTPTVREIIPLALVKKAVQWYYQTDTEAAFLERIPHVETTEETKRCMGVLN